MKQNRVLRTDNNARIDYHAVQLCKLRDALARLIAMTNEQAITHNDSSEAIAKRLRLTREALGYTQAIMCKLIGSATNGQAGDNYESGRRRISLTHALRLCDSCGLSLDWIYRGNYQSLAVGLRDKIIG
jgi:DNA-binding XRE family transcriptional regulator